jgi:CPA2 family monovalent cation:H+ antiporter-2
VAAERKEESDLKPTEQTNHAIVVGFGRVGHVLVEQIGLLKHDLVLIEEADHRAKPARALGLETIIGNAVREEVLNAANVKGARMLFVAVPDGFDSGQVVQQAKALNPNVRIIARAHSDEERDHLKKLGADEIVMGEREIGLAMVALSGNAPEPAPVEERSSPDTSGDDRHDADKEK